MSQIRLIGEYMDGAKFRDIISLVWSEVTPKKINWSRPETLLKLVLYEGHFRTLVLIDFLNIAQAGGEPRIFWVLFIISLKSSA